ncbi:hypothetical protein BH10ACT1_BH10ACT1_18870 [soil metagenome]
MHLQPIVDLSKATVAGFEALARFAEKPASPDRWFARAHQVGLGPDLEAAAADRALRRRPELGPEQFLTVNLSPAALSERSVQDVLRRHAPLVGVVVELTEHDPMGDRARLTLAIELVRSLGGLVAIDDIGTGYAGLEWLLSVRPEMVKLDREFIRGVDADEARTTFLRFVGDLVGQLDTWLIAEGIETDGELDVVVGLGVPLGQGYRLGHPELEVHGLEVDVQSRILTARRTFAHPTRQVAAHVDHVPTVRSLDDHEWTTARVVVVDEFGCPVLVAEADQPDRPSQPMRVKGSDDVHSVSIRALSRPEPDRWKPLVVTDDAGRYQGIIRMERLVRALSDDRSNPS